MKNILLTASIVIVAAYTILGTGDNIDYIKNEAPKHMAERNWKILRYEGNQWGAWWKHGGCCWYHVCNIDNPNIQYRVQVSSWRSELQYWYGKPEELSRINTSVHPTNSSMNSTPFQWTTENLFQRERFEAWLANQPGEREFDYCDNNGCLLCGFIRETTSFQLQGVAPSWARQIGSGYDDVIRIPEWLFKTLDEAMSLGTVIRGNGGVMDYKHLITINHARLAYQTLYGIDLTPKSEPVEETVKS